MKPRLRTPLFLFDALWKMSIDRAAFDSHAPRRFTPLTIAREVMLARFRAASAAAAPMARIPARTAAPAIFAIASPVLPAVTATLESASFTGEIACSIRLRASE